MVLSWVIWETTGSEMWVVAGAALRTAPAFFVGLFAGGVADWIDRRSLLRLTNLFLVITSVCFGLILLMDPVRLWLLLPMAFISGGLGAMQNIARQTYAFDLAGARNVVSSLSFISIAMRAGGGIGSLAIGFAMASMGAAFAYFALAATYALSGLSLYWLRTQGQAAPTDRASVLSNLKEFAVELRTNYTLLVLTVLVALVEILGFSHLAILPIFATDVLNVGPKGLGLMNAVNSFGGLFGIIILAAFGDIPRKGYAFMAATILFGVGLIFFGLSHTMIVALIAISVVSVAMSLSDVLSQSIMQLVVGNRLRGRAMGAWVVAIGTAPVGNLQIGAVAAVIGVSSALALNGAGLVVLGGLMYVLLKRLREV